MNSYLDIIPCGFFSFTDDGMIKEVNETLCNLLDYSESELKNKKVEEIFTIATRIFHQTHFFPLLKMQMFVSEIYVTLKNKMGIEVPVLLNAKRLKPEHAPAENICVCLVVYNRKKYEDEILEAKRKAELALKENTELLQAKKELQQYAEDLDARFLAIEQSHDDITQFNRVITHDLQEPLRKIAIFISLLKDNDKHNLMAETKELVNKISTVSVQLKRIILGLQQYVWLMDADKPKTEIDVNKLLLIVQRQIISSADENIVEFTMSDMPNIHGYWDQLMLLFYQLLQNAVKYRKQNKKVTIKITGTIVQENRFRKMKHKFKYEDYLRIEIKDDGIGFDKKYKSEIFSLFKKLHIQDGGLGIGLALCKKVMDNHGGFITAESKFNDGSSFICFFPLISREG